MGASLKLPNHENSKFKSENLQYANKTLSLLSRKKRLKYSNIVQELYTNLHFLYFASQFLFMAYLERLLVVAKSISNISLTDHFLSMLNVFVKPLPVLL